MDIKNQQELAKIITLCRKKGVESLKISENGNIEFKLGPAPIQNTKIRSTESLQEATEDAQALTAEQILFWSAGSMPEANMEGN